MATQPLFFDGEEYTVTQKTIAALRKGEIPQELQDEIRIAQGQEDLDEFIRRYKLMYKICSQIDDGEQPASIRPIVESGEVSSEILFKIYHHELDKKAEKLYRHGLISIEILQTVRKEVLTSEIVKPLSHAFHVYTAMYLYSKGQISKEILDGIRDGSIEYKFTKFIVRSARHERYDTDRQDIRTLPILYDQRGKPLLPMELATAPDEVEKGILAEERSAYLVRAISMLPPLQQEIIRLLFFENHTIIEISKELGYSRTNIRHHRDKALAAMKFIYQNVFCLPMDEILY